MAGASHLEISLFHQVGFLSPSQACFKALRLIFGEEKDTSWFVGSQRCRGINPSAAGEASATRFLKRYIRRPADSQGNVHARHSTQGSANTKTLTRATLACFDQGSPEQKRTPQATHQE